jgi:hypothetical protein
MPGLAVTRNRHLRPKRQLEMWQSAYGIGSVFFESSANRIRINLAQVLSLYKQPITPLDRESLVTQQSLPHTPKDLQAPQAPQALQVFGTVVGVGAGEAAAEAEGGPQIHPTDPHVFYSQISVHSTSVAEMFLHGKAALKLALMQVGRWDPMQF